MMHNFEAQEPPPPVGRGLRARVVTPRMETFNAQQARLAASRSKRQTTRASQHHDQVTQNGSQISQLNTPMPLPATPVVQLPQNLNFRSGISHPIVDRGDTEHGLVDWNVIQNMATSHADYQFDGNHGAEGVSDFGEAEDPSNDMTDPNEQDAHQAEQEELELEMRLSQLVPNTNHRISTTPIALQRPKPLVRRAQKPGAMNVLPVTPFAERRNQDNNLSATPLIRRAHLQSSELDKENSQAIFSPTIPTKRSYEDSSTSQDENDPDHSADAKLRRRADIMNPQRRRIFDLSVIKFRLKILKEDAFPDTATLEKFACEAWFEALSDLRDHHGYCGHTNATQEELDLIKTRLSQFRGHIVTTARTAVQAYYSLKTTGGAEAINDNRKRIADLLDKQAFVYRDPSNRHQQGGLYRSPLIPQVLNTACFNNGAQSEGLHGGVANSAVTLPAVALIVTAIHCALAEWKAGIKPTKPLFSATLYSKTYQEYLRNLKSWQEFSATRSGATRRFLEDLHSGALEHAGVSDYTNPEDDTLQLSFADFEANE